MSLSWRTRSRLIALVTALVMVGSLAIAPATVANAAGETYDISGRIYLGDYQTVAGAGEVSVEYRNGTTLVRSALTTSGGNYLIDDLPELIWPDYDYTVTYHYVGAGNYPDKTESLHWRHSSEWWVLLDSTSVITGHVSLGAVGVSAGAGEVRVELGSTQRVAFTDANGNYRIGGLNEGDYLLEFKYVGTGNYADVLWPDASIGVPWEYVHLAYVPLVEDIRLPDAGSISGRVTMNGSPLPNVNVLASYRLTPGPEEAPGAFGWLGGTGATTGTDGTFTLSRVRVEDYTLSFDAREKGRKQNWGGSLLDPSGAIFAIEAGDALTGMDADLTDGGRIRGAGTCPTCASLERSDESQVYVEALDPDTGGWVTLYVDSLDSYTSHFSYLAQYAGTYRVRASHRLGLDQWGSGYSDPLVVTGSDLTVNIPLVKSVSSRVGGQGRFDVSAGISQLGFDPGVPVVYIANGLNFPDALSAAPAASIQGGPLLLVTPDEIPAPVAAEIARLSPAKIVVVGGPASVSPTVFDQLDAMAGDIVRIGGLGRYEVSRGVAEYAFGGPGGPGADVAYVATGRNFPDALSAGGAAALQSAPVITVDGLAQQVDPETRQLLIDLGVKTVKIAGGPGSVSPALMASIDAIPGISVVRLWGLGRYQASGAINREVFHRPDVVFLSVGTNYPDALSGGALAGLWGAPLYVIPSDCIPHFVLEDIRSGAPERVIILGGPGSVEPDVLDFEECPWYDYWEL